ncbi:ATP-binding protein [Acidobacteria bacterium AH-259-O06]|nr:ATP-binding protein [Acidobacteria bacterium AH-259-O06]
MKNRVLKERLRQRATGKLGRLLVLTGSRQAGKTTLIKECFPQIPYISVEDPAVRPTFSRMSAADWIEHYPQAVIDEVQKAPSIVETVKAAYDESTRVRYFLLGSSQILLLSKVKESLAGRAAIEELWPLTLPEMATSSWEDHIEPSRMIVWLREGCASDEALLGQPAAERSFARYARLFEHYLRFGGMPVVHDADLTDDDRWAWLRDFQRTYLERDVADLAAMRDLEPFVVAQKVIATRAGKVVNFTDLARSAGIAPSTAHRFLRYLELSYQVVQLHPFFRNPEKRLAKMPKVHFVDPGIMRTILNRTGELTGEEFESAVVAEIFKQVRNSGLITDFFHLRTYDRREVDLLIELGHGFVAIEIKLSRHVSSADARTLRGVEVLLDKPLLKGLVLSLDRDVRQLAPGILALPVAWFLSPPTSR